MPAAPSISVAVLAGGTSRRMGTDKRALILDGTSMLDHAIAHITPIATTVILASGRVPVSRPGVLTVTDAAEGRGPLAGIVASLEGSPHDLCAIVAADMPDVDRDLLLALAVRCAGLDAAVPLSERGVEPLHAVYARSALRGLRSAMDSADPSVRGGLMRLRARYVNAAKVGAPPGFARNLNTPDDVSSWLADHRAGGPPPR